MSLRAANQVQNQYNTTRKIGPGRNLNIAGTAIIRHIADSKNQIGSLNRVGRDVNVVMQDGEINVKQIFNDAKDNLSYRKIPGNNRKM